MKKFKVYPKSVTASKNIKAGCGTGKSYVKSADDFVPSDDLDTLIKDMWYQTLDNYGGDVSYSDMIDIALEHVQMVIEEMDDDEKYTEYLPIVHTQEFENYVRECLNFD